MQGQISFELYQNLHFDVMLGEQYGLPHEHPPLTNERWQYFIDDINLQEWESDMFGSRVGYELAKRVVQYGQAFDLNGRNSAVMYSVRECISISCIKATPDSEARVRSMICMSA